jgi:hypothetical protein
MRVFIFDEDVLKKLLIEATYRFLVFDEQNSYSLPLNNYNLTASSRHFMANDQNNGGVFKILKYSSIKRVIVDDKEFFLS